MQAWPHQIRALRDIDAALGKGCRRLCVTSPTGGGKSLIMLELALRFLKEGLHVALYTNRRALLDQLSEVCLKAGVYHGIRAAGYTDEREHRFQICSIQTEYSRSIKGKRRDLHRANLVLVDEAHLHASNMAHAVLGKHRAEGAFVVGFTATPINIGHMYDELVQAGCVSELRQCGALVPAVHYAPDEPDMVSGLGKDLTETEQVSAMMRPGLFGRIWDNYCKINPERKPSICFGPGVQESIWIVEQFTNKGVRAAHIDGENVWIDGELHKTTTELRQEILNESKSGHIAVLCNRFVLREGIDCPWLCHGIFACVFGAVQSYLQSGGRLLRAHPGLSHVTIQDHGGNWWRHGSLNEDREWELGNTDRTLFQKRAERLREQPNKEPFRCPRCNRVWAKGRICNPALGGCGHELPEFRKRSRVVVTEAGDLKLVEGRIFRERETYKQPDGPKLWERLFWASRKHKTTRTFNAAFALFAQQYGWQWPDPSWPYMPKDMNDVYKPIANVPMDQLNPKAERMDNA